MIRVGQVLVLRKNYNSCFILRIVTRISITGCKGVYNKDTGLRNKG